MKDFNSPEYLEESLGRFKSKYIVNEDGCWVWQAGKDRDGYGQHCHANKNVRSHRFSYEQSEGPIPDGMHLDHYRMNPGPRNAPCSKACVNPAHLELVTPSENFKRGRGGRHEREKTHCPQGHPYSEGNTRHYRGKRQCKECNRAYCRERYRRSMKDLTP